MKISADDVRSLNTFVDLGLKPLRVWLMTPWIITSQNVTSLTFPLRMVFRFNWVEL